MKKIQVLGTGCPKCKALTELARQAAEKSGQPYEIEKITDVLRFADFGVMTTPALVVDGVLKVAGKLPSLEQVERMLA
ncbi:MAG: TM0996/MTH895 family glutaredoxin-like protein [Planctomycetes bacterium]|nr:TM0996/MTH895 family glutaredoxin-like protein [Planctomycetota bacterium]